jgi:hypothetical protein
MYNVLRSSSLPFLSPPTAETCDPILISKRITWQLTEINDFQPALQLNSCQWAENREFIFVTIFQDV